MSSKCSFIEISDEKAASDVAIGPYVSSVNLLNQSCIMMNVSNDNNHWFETNET